MTTESMTTRCKEIETSILRAMANVGQSRIAELMGVNASTVSRFKDSDIERFAAFLAATGLIVVPAGTPIVDEAELKALRLLVHLSTGRA